MQRICLCVVLAWLLSACGGVTSVNPASEGSDTRLDERLIGLWTVAADAPGGDAAAKEQVVFAIGRDPDVEGSLRMAFVQVQADGALSTGGGELRPTTIADRGYLSLRSEEPEGGRPKDEWAVLRYDLSPEGGLSVRLMDEHVVAADVRQGKIVGRTSESTPTEESEAILNVTLEAPTGTLRAWLAERGDALYPKERALVLRRLPSK